MTSITIPFGVIDIGDAAFLGCASLTSVTLPNSVTSIGGNAFLDCSGLTSVVIGNGVTTIEGWAFSDCTALTAVYFRGDAPELPGQNVFKDTSATIYYLPGTSGWSSTFGDRPTAAWNVDQVPFDYTFSNGAITITKYTGSGGDVVIPAAIDGVPVTGIGEAAFMGRSDLTSVTIPDCVTSIGMEAFGGCSSLTTIDIPDSVTSIGGYAFESCTKLTGATIGSGVAIIGSGTFESCTSLGAVYFRCDAPKVGPSYSDLPPISPLINTTATVFYLPGTSGWGALHWGRPTLPWSLVHGDVDGDGEVEREDLDVIVAARNTVAFGPEDTRDLDRDGMITVLDARIVVTLFAVPAGFTRIASSPEGVVVEWNENASVMTLQSTSDLRSGLWEDVGGVQSSTNTVIGISTERMFFRLILPE